MKFPDNVTGMYVTSALQVIVPMRRDVAPGALHVVRCTEVQLWGYQVWPRLSTVQTLLMYGDAINGDVNTMLIYFRVICINSAQQKITGWNQGTA